MMRGGAAKTRCYVQVVALRRCLSISKCAPGRARACDVQVLQGGGQHAQRLHRVNRDGEPTEASEVLHGRQVWWWGRGGGRDDAGACWAEVSYRAYNQASKQPLHASVRRAQQLCTLTHKGAVARQL